MVKIVDSETVISSTVYEHPTQPSIKRCLKHTFYFKSSKKLFTTEQKQKIADAVTEAEHGHRGEIKIIIEASMPSHIAFELDTRQRAEQLFAEYRVWDTEYNSGILLYLNLCEHRLEIVADRGINNAVAKDDWSSICDTILLFFKQGQFLDGLCDGIRIIGSLIDQFYKTDNFDPIGNELPNEPKLI